MIQAGPGQGQVVCVAFGTRYPVRCACCGQPVAELVLVDGALQLEIIGRHHGERHVTALTVGQIGAILSGNGAG